MGVTFTACQKCGEVYSGCGDYSRCSEDLGGCGECFCSVECSQIRTEGYGNRAITWKEYHALDDEEALAALKTSCVRCRGEFVRTSEVLQFLLDRANLTLSEALALYKSRK